MWGAACAPSISVSGAGGVRHLDDLLDRVDGAERVRDMVTATMRVRGLSSFSYSSMRSSPRSFMGITRSLAPFSSQSICQGTMLEWCSMAEMMISSPALTFCRPQELLTRLMPSVVPRTKISSIFDCAR